MKSKLGVLCNEDRGISVDSSPMVTVLRQHVKIPKYLSAKPSISDRSDLHPQHGGDARGVGGGSGGGARARGAHGIARAFSNIPRAGRA